MEDCKGDSSIVATSNVVSSIVAGKMDDSKEDGVDEDSKVPAKVDGSNMDENIKQDDSYKLDKLEDVSSDIDNDAIIFGIRQIWRKKYIK